MDKDFDSWNKAKKAINGTDPVDFVHEREVRWCSLGVNVGVEQDGKNERFERPVIIVKKFSKESVLAVPTTTKIKEGNRYHHPFEYRGNRYSAVISQVRILSTKRLARRLYTMDESTFEGIRAAIKEMI